MSKFKIKSNKKNNSFPNIKIALRKWVIEHVKNPCVLDVYGGNGLMYEKIWKTNSKHYRHSEGDAISWLTREKIFAENIFDVDPYASPFEAIEIICKKCTSDFIGISATDGMLRRVSMMRTKLPEFIQTRCGWPERDMKLMAGIYNQYPSFLRHVIKSIAPNYEIEKLVVKYCQGTWKQATVYFGVILIRRTSCAPESPAQNTKKICHTAPNSAMLQGLKPHAGNTGTSA